MIGGGTAAPPDASTATTHAGNRRVRPSPPVVPIVVGIGAVTAGRDDEKQRSGYK
jgi:hypothetical protein